MHVVSGTVMRAVASVLASFVGVLLFAASQVATAEALVSRVPQVFRITNLLRTIDLTQTLVRETTSAAILNTGTELQSEYYFPVDQAYTPNLALITAENRKTKESLEIEKDSQYTNEQYQFYKVHLSPPLGAGEKIQITVKYVLSNFIRPFPARIGQSEKQGFMYSGNAFALSAYPASKQKTTVQTPGKNMQIHARPVDSKVQVTSNELVLGPFGKMEAFVQDALQVEYEKPGPVIHFREFRCDVEVTHWGNNLAFEDHYNFINRGAGLKGQYIRKGARRSPANVEGGNPVKAFVVGIPKLARDIYYRDEIGNISTSSIHHLDKAIELSLVPRFPVFGGWNTTFYTGYNAPLDGFLHHVPDTEKHILKMYLFDLIKESSYDKVEVRIVLPEGSKNVKAHLPFNVDSIEYSVSKTYMDSAGRSTVNIKARNLVEDHVRELFVEYEYPESAYLIKPLAAASMVQRTMASINNGNNNSNNSNNSSAASTFASAAGSGTLQALKPNVVDRYWNDIAEHFREPGFSTFDKEKSSQVIRDPEFMRKLLVAVITDRPGQGDILPSVIAKSSCDFFVSLDKAGKSDFLRLLARDFGVLQEDVAKAARQYADQVKQDPESKALLRAEQVLRHAIVPGHNKFFDRVSRLPGGLKFLIDMRHDLLTILGENRTDFYLAALNESLKEKLQAWFVGFLDLERLTWQSPAVLLEKITQYEAVHKFKDVQDLKRRVGPGRRVFALMNKSVPTEPLVFVQVALVNTLSNNVQDILNDPSPGHANPAETVKCAIFYSITTQVGLSGIELGNFLIKRVVRSLKVEFPQIETFSTLSPIPGFRRWIAQCQGLGQKLLLPEEESIISQLSRESGGDAEGQFGALLKQTSTFSDKDKVTELRPILTRLCARYILLEKRRHLALDPVANFHLRNGACAHRLNWMGDASSKGMEESFGMMINYLYSLDHIEMNNQQYLQDGTISVSLPEGGFLRVVQDAHGISGSSMSRTVGSSDASQTGELVELHGVKLRLLNITTA